MSYTEMLAIPLTPAFGAIAIFAGLYSLTINKNAARQKNHPQSETFCRICGWLYIGFGCALIAYCIFF